ncbi:hypothetical protein [Mesorhizobium sp. ANAO-SY3R2]|uniref:hypothetical protein n=1 Tax=Mesorhizobium sp. ANAO-SY3R2 TaxID=3166644 RepID=UPI00366B4EDD
MQSLLPIIIQIVTGIIGGQAIGAALQQAAMGQVTRLLAGGVGGIAGGQILGSLLGDPATAGALSGMLGWSAP